MCLAIAIPKLLENLISKKDIIFWQISAKNPLFHQNKTVLHENIDEIKFPFMIFLIPDKI